VAIEKSLATAPNLKANYPECTFLIFAAERPHAHDIPTCDLTVVGQLTQLHGESVDQAGLSVEIFLAYLLHKYVPHYMLYISM